MKAIPRLLAVWLVLLVAVAALRALTASHGEMEYTDALGTTFKAPPYDHVATATALALLLLGAWLSGKVFKILALPRITGYIAFGVLVGPSLISLIAPQAPPLLSKPQMEHLRLFSSLAIALIGLTAGGEIRIELLRRGLWKVLTIVAIVVTTVLVCVFGGLYFARSALGFLSDLPGTELVVVCLMLAVIATSNSPAVLVALLSELRSSGPMSETSLAVTVIKDLAVVVLFTIASAVGFSLLQTEGGGASRGDLVMNLAWHLLGSVAAGATLGILMSTILHHLRGHMLLFVLAMSLGIVLVSESAHFEPLLVALSAGFLLANLWPDRSRELFHSVEELSLPVYCIFFAIAGAKIDLAALAHLWPLALAIVAVRSVAVWGGVSLGARLTALGPPASTWLWTAFIPQAGIAVALAASIENLFVDFHWGAKLTSLLLATIAIFECFGPILLRLGLIKAGETRG